MVDSKTKFVLSLQGKEYAGHLEQWSVDRGDLAGLGTSGDYQLVARYNNYQLIDNEYAISKHTYVTLGQQCTHKEVVEMYTNKTRHGIKNDKTKIPMA